MREDMFKIIVERPRRGKGWATRSRRRLNRDGDLPTKIGVNRHVAVTQVRLKSLSENLAPLKRYLAKQVGRPWDTVRSEITATLKRRDPVQQHVLLHVDGFVARDLFVDAKGELATTSRGFVRTVPWHEPYYVDPTDGLLKDSETLWKKRGYASRRLRRNKKRVDPNVRSLDNAREHRRINGIWYEIGYQPAPDPYALVYDIVSRTLVRAGERVAISKRQLSKAELRAFQIENTHQH